MGPGFKLAIVGRFEHNVLVSGRQARVKSERCFNGLKHVETSEPVKCLTLTKEIFSYRRYTSIGFGVLSVEKIAHEKVIIFFSI